MNIRAAVEADIQALVVLDTFAADHPGRVDQIVAWVRAGEAVVAEMEGRAVGYAAVRRIFFGEAFTDMLMVAAGARRTGVGRALMRHIHANAVGPRLWVSTNESNAPMRSLLASEGYAFAGKIEGLTEGDAELFFFRLT